MADKSSLQGYKNRFNPEDGYKEVLFRSSKGAQSAELNELQEYIQRDRLNLSNCLFKNATLVSGGKIQVNGQSAFLDAGVFYSEGHMHEINTAEFTISGTETVDIGVNLIDVLIDEIVDPSLRDPSPGTKNYGEPGACRYKYVAVWRKSSEVTDGRFFPVYKFEDGAYLETGTPTSIDKNSTFIDSLAKYDRNSNGSYVINGMQVVYISDDNDASAHDCSVKSGSANVDGYNIEFSYDHRFQIPYALSMSLVSNEPISFTGDGYYDVRWSPVATVHEVNGTKQVTETVTRGSIIGGTDLLGNSPVINIVSVKKGSTTYTATTDYVQDGDRISWAPGGSEPATGETYTVVYNYQYTLSSVDYSSDRTQINLIGFLSGTVVYVDYEFYLPRYDRVVILRDGSVVNIEGVPDKSSPQPPTTTSGLSLAYVYVSYGNAPIVTLDYYRTYKMSDIQTLANDISDIKFNLSQLFLRDNVRSLAPSVSKLDIFVDPFDNTDLTDTGISQNAIVAGGELIPSVEWEYIPLNTPTDFTLPFGEETVVSQSQRSSGTKINKYISADPDPGSLTLTPTNYRWMSSQTYKEIATWRTILHLGNLGTIRSSQGTTNVDTDTTSIIPQITIGINSSLYNGGETVKLYFDGVYVQDYTASSAGIVSGSFTVPSGILSGSKIVKLVGQTSGVIATSTFVASAYVRNVIEYALYTYYYDPVAETFTLPGDSYISSVDLMFKTKPTSYVDVSLCETYAGVPDKNKVIARTRLYPDQIQLADGSSSIVYNQTFSNHEHNGFTECSIKDKVYSAHDPAVPLSLGQFGACGTGNQKVTSPIFNSVNHTSVILKFKLTPIDLEVAQGDTLTVQWYDGSVWHTLSTYAATALTNRTANQLTFNISNEWRSTNNKFRVYLSSGNTAGGWYDSWAITDVQITGTSSTNGRFTKFNFPNLVKVNMDEEYAIVVQTLDNNAEIWIAELGKYDSINSKWISKQPYAAGVLLESSNAKTWTPVQSVDMVFRVNVAKFSDLAATYSIQGNFASDESAADISGYTDYILLASELTPSGTSINYNLVMEDETYAVTPYTQLIRTAYTGSYSLSLNLKTTNQYLTPVVQKDLVLAIGKVQLPSKYISRSFTVTSTATSLKVYLDATIPSGASITVYYGREEFSLNDGGVTNKWIKSSKGTNEYYYYQNLDSYPEVVEYSQNTLTQGSLGSLNALEYAYGDNDSIGHSRLYVRLSDDADPDSKTSGSLTCLKWTVMTQGTTSLQENGYLLVPYSATISSLTSTRLKVVLDSTSVVSRPTVGGLKSYTS